MSENTKLNNRLSEEDIYIVDCGDEGSTIQFNSLEGDPILWTHEEAKQLKKEILNNQFLRQKIEELYNKTLYQRNTISPNIPPQTSAHDNLLEWENKLKKIMNLTDHSGDKS